VLRPTAMATLYVAQGQRLIAPLALAFQALVMVLAPSCRIASRPSRDFQAPINLAVGRAASLLPAAWQRVQQTLQMMCDQ
jgi:hypothetical protein